MSGHPFESAATPSGANTASPEQRRLEVGRIGKAHGLRGEIVLSATTNRVERFAPGSVLYADGRTLVIATARRKSDRWIVRFEGVDDRDATVALRGLIVSGDPLESLGADEFWVHELVGCVVCEESGACLGPVVAVHANPAHDLLEVDGGVLVPIVFVVEHSSERIVVRLPVGLLEATARPGQEPQSSG